MKRDLDLIRKILLYAEQQDELFDSASIIISDYTSKEITHHVGLLAERRYLDVTAVHNGLSGKTIYAIKGITFAGYDYLDAVRKSQIWERVKDRAAQTGVSLTMDIAKEYAVKLAQQLLGVS